MKRSKGWKRLFIVCCVIWLPFSVLVAEWFFRNLGIDEKNAAVVFPFMFGTWLIGALGGYLIWRIFWWVVDGFNTKGPEKDE